MIVTFLYRIHETVYHGKYIGYISDDYEEGLDIEIRRIFYPIWKHAYSLQSISDVYVGILSYQRKEYEYFSEHEKYVFTSLYCNWDTESEIFIDGVPSWKHSNSILKTDSDSNSD